MATTDAKTRFLYFLYLVIKNQLNKSVFKFHGLRVEVRDCEGQYLIKKAERSLRAI